MVKNSRQFVRKKSENRPKIVGKWSKKPDQQIKFQTLNAHRYSSAIKAFLCWSCVHVFTSWFSCSRFDKTALSLLKQSISDFWHFFRLQGKPYLKSFSINFFLLFGILFWFLGSNYKYLLGVLTWFLQHEQFLKTKMKKAGPSIDVFYNEFWANFVFTANLSFIHKN